MGKKVITQKDLDKMSPAEVLNLDPNRIPFGFDIAHNNGNNAKLVPEASKEPHKAPPPAAANSDSSPSDDQAPRHDDRKVEDNSGVLFLRFFKKDDTNGKILTRYKRKVYFPLDNKIEPGWYVATIIEERENHGIMETMPLSAIDPILWKPACIKGIYVKRNHAENTLEIYPAIPKDQLEEQQPTLIYTVKLETPVKKSGASIGEIIAAKRAEALKG